MVDFANHLILLSPSHTFSIYNVLTLPKVLWYCLPLIFINEYIPNVLRRFCLFPRLLFLILEFFRQCGIVFVFHFIVAVPYDCHYLLYFTVDITYCTLRLTHYLLYLTVDIIYCTLRLTHYLLYLTVDTLPTVPYGWHYLLYLTVDITYCTLRLTLPTVPYG
jgi:hypothetical protein